MWTVENRLNFKTNPTHWKLILRIENRTQCVFNCRRQTKWSFNCCRHNKHSKPSKVFGPPGISRSHGLFIWAFLYFSSPNKVYFIIIINQVVICNRSRENSKMKGLSDWSTEFLTCCCGFWSAKFNETYNWLPNESKRWLRWLYSLTYLDQSRPFTATTWWPAHLRIYLWSKMTRVLWRCAHEHTKTCLGQLSMS